MWFTVGFCDMCSYSHLFVFLTFHFILVLFFAEKETWVEHEVFIQHVSTNCPEAVRYWVDYVGKEPHGPSLHGNQSPRGIHTGKCCDGKVQSIMSVYKVGEGFLLEVKDQEELPRRFRNLREHCLHSGDWFLKSIWQYVVSATLLLFFLHYERRTWGLNNCL